LWRCTQGRLYLPGQGKGCQLDANRPGKQPLDVDPSIGDTERRTAEQPQLDSLGTLGDGLGKALAHCPFDRIVHVTQRKPQLQPMATPFHQVPMGPKYLRQEG
jgi:hypothetical protein